MHTDISDPVWRTSRLELLGLTRRFGDVLAVQGGSSTAEPGAITGFPEHFHPTLEERWEVLERS